MSHYLHVYRAPSGQWSGKVLEEVAGIAGCKYPAEVVGEARDRYPDVADLPSNATHPNDDAEHAPMECLQCGWQGPRHEADETDVEEGDDWDVVPVCPSCSEPVSAIPAPWRYTLEIMPYSPKDRGAGYGWTGTVYLNGTELGQVSAGTVRQVKSLARAGWPLAEVTYEPAGAK
ncbi:hypothetical protein [Stenotrophomonas acidaminiphila]|uniref:hypothetical protein n=1 Tax=Stenotrophomonas acidaminiphila TaxID=128780 RepID=UPI001E37C774|nr:hypothetical protein [Stenotrophomonas acidaminiphila]